MTDKKYLLTHYEICQLERIARSALAYEADGNVGMAELAQRMYSSTLAVHEYQERTCRMMHHDAASAAMCGPAAKCSECGACVPEVGTIKFCPNCGAKVTDDAD